MRGNDHICPSSPSRRSFYRHALFEEPDEMFANFTRLKGIFVLAFYVSFLPRLRLLQVKGYDVFCLTDFPSNTLSEMLEMHGEIL